MSPSSESNSFRSQRSSGDRTPRSSNRKELGEHGTRGERDSDRSAEEARKAPLKRARSNKEEPRHKGGIPKDKSRRLVEYFVVVSSVPKIRRRKDPEKSPKEGEGKPARRKSPRQSPQIRKRKGPEKSAEEREGKSDPGGTSLKSPGQSSQTSRRKDPPKSLQERDGKSVQRQTAVKSPQQSSPTTAKGNARRASLTADAGSHDEKSTTRRSSLSSIESLTAIGELVFGEPLPDERRSNANAQILERMIGDAVFGESEASDGGTTASNAAAPTPKNSFFRSMEEQRRRIQGNVAKLERATQRRNASMQRMNAAALQNLEKTMEGLSLDRTLAKFKSAGFSIQRKDDRSDSSDSSRDGAEPDAKERIASYFRPSRIPTSARRPPPQGASDNIENIRIYRERGLSERERDDGAGRALEPKITARYPLADHPDQPLNPMLPHFCHPRGTDRMAPLDEYRMPSVHHFVLTDCRGGKLYGTCLTVYEEISFPSDIDIESGEHHGQDRLSSSGSPNEGQLRTPPKPDKCYAPRVLCLLSKWPYLSAFRTYLVQLYRLATTTNLMAAPLERYVLNICAEVPAPPPGAFEVGLSILGSDVRFWAPPAGQPIPYVSLPYGALFECLDVSNVLFAWYTLACERQLLLVSGQLSLLTVCAEILCSMLFPMRWSHLYIPCLPRLLTQMLDAPMPYLCGISREAFQRAEHQISEEAVVVDLDRNMITMGRLTPDLPSLPYRHKAKLEAVLEQHAYGVFWKARGLTPSKVEWARSNGDEDVLANMLGKADAVWDEKVCLMDEAFNIAHAPDSMTLLYSEGDVGPDDEGKQSRWDVVQEAFLRFYVSMLRDYRKYMPSTPNGSQSTWRGLDSADAARFLADEFVQSRPPECRPFLAELVGSQQFDDFVTRRMYNAGDAPDIEFFDKSNKLNIESPEAPFLHSARAHQQLKQVQAVQPNEDDLPARSRTNGRFNFKKGEYNYLTWPESFDESLFGKPRPPFGAGLAKKSRSRGASSAKKASSHQRRTRDPPGHRPDNGSGGWCSQLI